jgi:hypothetical protein
MTRQVILLHVLRSPASPTFITVSAPVCDVYQRTS